MAATGILRRPTWRPSPNINIRLASIVAPTIIGKIGTSRKNAPRLAKRRSPENVKR
jgi:hypothetical protein